MKKRCCLTWHESSETTKEPVCEFVTPSSLPQYDSSTPCKDSVCESITPRCVPGYILTPPTNEFVITFTQIGWREVSTQEPIVTEVNNEVPIVEEVGTQEFSVKDVVVEDYVSFGEDGEDAEQGNGQEDESTPTNGQFFCDDEGIETTYETEYDVQYSEDAGTDDDDDDDDVDKYFLVDEENEIVEPDVDVHLFDISMGLPFNNIGITNLVSDDVLEGEDVDVIIADGFDSDPGNDEEKITGREVRAVQDQLQRELEVQISISKAFRAKAKAKREIRGDHVVKYSMLREYVVELQSTNPNTTVKIAVERNTDPSLPTRVLQRIYICLGALKLGFRACKRDLLGLDDAFIKGQFPGQVLIAVGLDLNNGIYPLAYALVEAESKSSWC
nr:transposase, MuDR, MULE transposase domain protein [Tanacetum cinerariifolium]